MPRAPLAPPDPPGMARRRRSWPLRMKSSISGPPPKPPPLPPPPPGRLPPPLPHGPPPLPPPPPQGPPPPRGFQAMNRPFVEVSVA
ncbi:Submaxillary gland androgen regulated protein 1 precursor [Paramagnetospirillum magneticum AMB-1]|uniref:Submaxillary gland androgen regulated protein 1 n=1 Tax=Paramagnetospirillum magneticum (strain ATCC 700264 / AMB-1) TaxID=342108 RepID=Q2W1I3_PARM1|nr:Submaxillary gland androgen regulated protein 1 precursor [Paramagnetospirillum magneticum AMB-1]